MIKGRNCGIGPRYLCMRIAVQSKSWGVMGRLCQNTCSCNNEIHQDAMFAWVRAVKAWLFDSKDESFIDSRPFHSFQGKPGQVRIRRPHFRMYASDSTCMICMYYMQYMTIYYWHLLAKLCARFRLCSPEPGANFPCFDMVILGCIRCKELSQTCI